MTDENIADDIIGTADKRIADAIIVMAQAIITHRGQLGGWEALSPRCHKNFGCQYEPWVTDPDSGAPDTTMFNIEYGVYFGCTGEDCEGDCDDSDTVNVQIGWTGLTEESACTIMQYIDEHIDKCAPDFWLEETK